MRFTPLGTIGKPHGLKGAFVLAGYDGDGDIFSVPVTYSVDHGGGNISEHTLLRALCLNSRWVLHLTEIDSIEKAEALRGASVLCPTDELAAQLPQQDGVYPVAALVGAEVRDFESDLKIGTFLGIEEAGPATTGAQRWWIRGVTIEFSVPNHETFLAKVDPEARIVWLRNWKELEALALPETKG